MTLRQRSYLIEMDMTPGMVRFANALGFDRSLKSIPMKPHLYQCPECHCEHAYKKEFHPDTGFDEVLGYCPDCRHTGASGDFIPVEQLGEGRRIKGKTSFLEKFKEKHGIVSKKAQSRHSVHSIGFSEREQKFYGWSHRAIVGFGIGDKIFEPNFGGEHTPFVKHGKKTIKNMADAEKAARAFARYVS